MKRILLIDDDDEFRSTRVEYLERANYPTIQAASFDQGKLLLVEEWTPLAIIDVRLRDDQDEKDLSGLLLAQQDTRGVIAKIILTNYPTPELVREFLRLQWTGKPLAVDFIYKGEDPDKLIQAVNDAFANHVRINWDLGIEWNARDPLALVNLVEPGLEGARLLNRAEEFEDLFRRLFFEKNHIRVERLLWQRDARAALTVFAFKEDGAPEAFVMVCGQNERIVKEAQHFLDVSPRAPGDTATTLPLRAETTHFAANAYALADTDLENLVTLFERYQVSPERVFNATLTYLFQTTLKEWHQGKPFFATDKGLVESYGERFGLAARPFARDAFQARLDLLFAEIPKLGTRIKRDGESLTFDFGTKSATFAEPLFTLNRAMELKRDAMLINTSGALSGNNILTDTKGRTWLTDFADAGRAPLGWNYVELEAAIRFDWVETNDLRRRFELEECLVKGDFRRPDLIDLEPVVHKAGHAIQGLRRLAREINDPSSYHLGILFEAARRIWEFNPALPLTHKQVARLAQGLFAIGLIGESILDDEPPPSERPVSEQGLRLNQPNRAVYKNGRRVQLSGQSYKLFVYMYERQGDLCTRQELIEHIMREKFNPNDKNQVARLNVAILRVRKRIEDDPNEPRYLLMDLGNGYHLVLQP